MRFSMIRRGRYSDFFEVSLDGLDAIRPPARKEIFYRREKNVRLLDVGHMSAFFYDQQAGIGEGGGPGLRGLDGDHVVTAVNHQGRYRNFLQCRLDVPLPQ